MKIPVPSDVVKKATDTLDGCAKACLEETTLKCQFFRFENETKTCFMTADDKRGHQPVASKYIFIITKIVLHLQCSIKKFFKGGLGCSEIQW